MRRPARHLGEQVRLPDGRVGLLERCVLGVALVRLPDESAHPINVRHIEPAGADT